MSETTPTERALRILAVLQDGRLATATQLAARLGVHPRTARRDLERLRALGYRIDADAGPGGGYRLGHAGRLPPLHLDALQAEAVAVGLQLVAASGFDDLAYEAIAAARSLGAHLAPEAAARADRVAAALAVVPSGGANVEAAMRTGLSRAIASRVRVRFGYAARSGSPGERHVEPTRIVRFGVNWYLVAFDLDRNDWRTFRLDRMRDLHVTTFGFRPRPAPDAVARVRDAVLRAHAGRHVHVRLRGGLDELRARIPVTAGTLVARGDDETVLVTGGDADAHTARFLASLDAEILGIGPAAVAEAVRQHGRRLAAIEDDAGIANDAGIEGGTVGRPE